jgi:hypothetical protein
VLENKKVTSLADPNLFRLRRLVATVQRRHCLSEMRSIMLRSVPLQIGAMCVFVGAECLLRPSWAPAASTRWLVLAAIVSTPGLLMAVTLTRRKTPKYAISLLIDRHGHHGDLLTSALCFAERGNRSPLEQLVVEQAIDRIDSVDPRQVVPLGHSPRLWLLVCLALLLGTFPRQSGGRRLVVRAPEVAAPGKEASAPAGLRQIRVILEDLAKEVQSPEAQAEVERLRQSLDAFVRGRVDVQAANNELSAAAQRMAAQNLSISTEFSASARALADHPSTKQLGEALSQGRMADASKALQALEARWRLPRTRLSPEELQSLRHAVETERASRKRSQSADLAERSRLKAERRGLLDEKAAGRDSPAGEERIEELSRRLEYLERRKTAADQAEPALSALDRAILQAAQTLGRELGRDLDGFDQAKLEFERLERLARSDAEKRLILERIEQIRERLRQLDQGDEHRAVALRRFGQRAGGPDQSAGPRADGEHPRPEAQPSPSGQALLIGMVPLPVGVASQVSKSSRRSGGGPSTGDRHEADVRGDPKGSVARPSKDAAVVAKDTGRGGVSAEVVAAAAERGFGARSYREVFRAYAPVTESLLGQPEVPLPYKQQVRRYFQLIMPRENEE